MIGWLLCQLGMHDLEEIEVNRMYRGSYLSVEYRKFCRRCSHNDQTSIWDTWHIGHAAAARGLAEQVRQMAKEI